MKAKRIICILMITCMALSSMLTAAADNAEREVDTLFYEQFDYTKGLSISQSAAARMKGAKVVFATSIYRHAFESNGDAAYSHYGYPEAMVDTAAETGTPLLDLCSVTGEWLQELGQDASLKYYLAFYGGDDHTHLTYDGAVEIANMALNEIRRIGHPLKDAFTSVPLR